MSDIFSIFESITSVLRYCTKLMLIFIS